MTGKEHLKNGEVGFLAVSVELSFLQYCLDLYIVNVYVCVLKPVVVVLLVMGGRLLPGLLYCYKSVSHPGLFIILTVGLSSPNSSSSSSYSALRKSKHSKADSTIRLISEVVLFLLLLQPCNKCQYLWIPFLSHIQHTGHEASHRLIMNTEPCVFWL